MKNLIALVVGVLVGIAATFVWHQAVAAVISDLREVDSVTVGPSNIYIRKVVDSSNGVVCYAYAGSGISCLQVASTSRPAIK